MKKTENLWKYICDKSHLVCAILLVLYVTMIVANAVLEGVERINTEHKINETYRIVK